MPWAKYLLLFTVCVMMLSSSIKADSKAFSETGAYGAVSENTVYFGKLLIGGESTVSDSDTRTSGLRSLKSNYGKSHLVKTKLQHRSPSVQCSNDSMILRIPGSRTPNVLVDRGEESPVPLLEMPASCGFSLKRVRRDLSFVAPYRGCNVRRQGGNFVLPLIIMGTRTQISCPVSACLPDVSCSSSGMTFSLGVRANDVKVKVDGSWQPLLMTLSQCSFELDTTDDSLVVTAPFTGSCLEMTDTEWQLPLMYGDREVTISCRLAQPTTAPTTPPTRDPHMQMFGPFPFRPSWYPPYPGVRSTLPPTVPRTTATPLQYPIYPWPYFFSKRDPPYWPQKPYPFPMYPPFYGPLYPDPLVVPRSPKSVSWYRSRK
ncbi:uncharacterized protein LOC122353821 [Puntigrus tetrazona]|uniref:uncharacterized protein LOC122353821 n=1 Tax=Puntigrus tetrazona TaxID=1606681 RepID=UPI001C8A7B81|nr:uncharacterized protein LOC122353821 [Puntigrus tetrazona]